MSNYFWKLWPHDEEEEEEEEEEDGDDDASAQLNMLLLDTNLSKCCYMLDGCGFHWFQSTISQCLNWIQECLFITFHIIKTCNKFLKQLNI